MAACIDVGLVGGTSFAVDASLIAADANKCRSMPGDAWSRDIDPTTVERAVQDYLVNLDNPAWESCHAQADHADRAATRSPTFRALPIAAIAR